MAKAAEWRKKLEDWKGILNQPKDAGLKIGGTGISEALRKVVEAEAAFEAAKQPGREITSILADLDAALVSLETLCKKISDKSKALTTACKFLDGVKAEATARRSTAAREFDAARKPVGGQCGERLKHLRAAKEIGEFARAWAAFAQDF